MSSPDCARHQSRVFWRIEAGRSGSFAARLIHVLEATSRLMTFR